MLLSPCMRNCRAVLQVLARLDYKRKFFAHTAFALHHNLPSTARIGLHAYTCHRARFVCWLWSARTLRLPRVKIHHLGRFRVALGCLGLTYTASVVSEDNTHSPEYERLSVDSSVHGRRLSLWVSSESLFTTSDFYHHIHLLIFSRLPCFKRLMNTAICAP